MIKQNSPPANTQVPANTRPTAHVKHKVLHNFDYESGSQPRSSVVFGSDGNMYGTTTDGGKNEAGTVFKLTPTGEHTLLHSFNEADGALPVTSLTFGPDGCLYGGTYSGGEHDVGTIYKITKEGKFTKLHSFDFDFITAVSPMTSLLTFDGKLYGAAEHGGEYNKGVIYSITPDGDFSTFFSFDGTSGAHPESGLALDNEHNMWGTTSEGGDKGQGTIYKINQAGEHTIIHLFENNGNDTASATVAHCSTLVFDGESAFYGTITYMNDRYDTDREIVYKISTSGEYEELLTFDSDTTNGIGSSLLYTKSRVLYGIATTAGNKGSGTVFQIMPDGEVTLLHSFSAKTGNLPRAALTIDDAGILYGTTTYGGKHNAGTVFSIEVY